MLFEMFLILIVVTLVSYLVFKWFSSMNDYFASTEFAYVKPSRIFGNSINLKTTGREAAEILDKLCPNEK